MMLSELQKRMGPNVRRALTSSSWLIIERATFLIANFIVGILLARYLGPQAFGSLNYAIAFVALIAVIPYLGLASVVVQELTHHPDGRAEIIGTVFWAKFAAGSIAVVVANVLATFFAAGATERLLIMLISVSMVFDASSATRLLFEART